MSRKFLGTLGFLDHHTIPMKIQGAVVKEQGVTFGIVIVKSSAMSSSFESDRTRTAFQGLFPGMSLILASQDSCGVFKYQGREDIVNFLALIDASRIPWMEYTVS
jgi:hypothetical protein